MFIKSRILYIVSTQKFDSSKIFSDLKKANLVNKFFSGEDTDNISKELNIFLNMLPAGTVFSKTVVDGMFFDSSTYYVSLPFFSSHIKSPLKAGEYVWLYQHKDENQTGDFSIDTYWVSRVHGLNFSEDVNYTYNDRDNIIKPEAILRMYEDFTIPKKSLAKQQQKKVISIANNALLKPDNSIGESTFEISDNERELIESQVLNYKKTCVPVTNGNSDDLILQGSNNTLIRLTTDNSNYGTYQQNPKGSGEITISAGQGRYALGSYRTSSGFLFDNEGDVIKDDSFVLFKPDNSISPINVLIDNKYENIKNEKIFNIANNDLNFNKRNEGAFKVLEDASRITITENYNCSLEFNNSYNTFLNINFDKNKVLTREFDSSLLNTEIFDKNKKDGSKIDRNDKKFTTSYCVKSNKAINEKSHLPTIAMVSDNVNILSRQSADGELCLAKDYYSYETGRKMSSYLRINSNGDAFIDANRVFIGSFALYKEKDKISEGKSKSALIYLGASESNQSLVLGEQLKEYLNEILDVSREDMDITKKLFLKTHSTLKKTNEKLVEEFKLKFEELDREFAKNLANPKVVGIAAAPQAPGPATASVFTEIFALFKKQSSAVLSLIKNFDDSRIKIENNFISTINKQKLKREEDLSKRLEAIEHNIDKILSKVSKTS